MTNDNWQQFVETAKGKFEDVSLATEDLYIDNIDSPGPHGTVDVLEFDMPAGFPITGRYQVRRENKPLVLDKKMHYSHRAGDTARTEYVLSDSEMSHKIKVYKEDDFGEWQEITPQALGL